MYYAQLRPSFDSTLAQFRASYVSDSITINDDYPRSSVNLTGSSVVGDGDAALITIKPRLQESEVVGTSRWLEPSAKLIGVNGVRPTFRFIDYTSGVYHGYPWQTTRRPMFSYDRETWFYFDTQTIGGSYIEFRHNTAFTSDTIYVGRGRQTSVNQTGQWLDAVATAYSTLIGPTDSAAAFTPTLTGWAGQSFIAGEFASQTNELGGTIPATPFYAAQINDTSLMPPSGVKRLAVVTAGIHAGEDHSEYALRQFVEYALGSATVAQDLRRHYKILIYPLLNAPGRDGGGWRGSFTQGVGGIDDGNRHFSDASPGLEIVTIPRTAMLADMGADTPDWAIDWHGTYFNNYSLFVDSGNTLQADFRTRLATNSGFTVNDEGDTVAGFISRWYQDTVGAQMAVTLEHGDVSAVSDANLVTWGQAVVVSLDAMRSAGLFGPASAAIAGSVTTSITPAATLSQQSHHAITGDVTASVTPASTLYFGSGDYIQGDVTISATPSGLMSFTRHAAIAGNVTVNLTPSAVMAAQQHHVIVGDVAVTVTPASVMNYGLLAPVQNILAARSVSRRLTTRPRQTNSRRP